MTTQDNASITILGNGYCGSRLHEAMPGSIITSRKPVNQEMLYFKLDDELSWLNIPCSKTVIWTFACLNTPLENKFFEFLQNHCEKIFIYSTSSVYIHSHNEQIIDEGSELDMQRARTIAEEKYRSEGACILTLCGISGPGRSPLNWLKKGIIKNANKEVNLIHVDDIVEITKRLITEELSAQRINLVPGVTYSWLAIANSIDYEFNSEALSQKTSKKLIKSTILTEFLPKSYKFRKPLV
jgi:hypothetical protein